MQYAENGYEIVNAASAGKSPTPKSLAVAAGITVMTPPAQIESGTKHNHTIKVSNTREFPLTVRISVDQESLISDGWSFYVDPPEIEIPAKSSKNVTLQTSSAPGIGAANYLLRAQVVPRDSIRGLSTKAQTTVISKEQDIVLIHFPGTPQAATLQNWSDLQTSPLYAKKVSIIALNDSNVNVFDFSTARAFIVPESYMSRTTLLFNTKKVLPFIDAQFKAGKPFLIWSPMNLWIVADNYPATIMSEQIKQVWHSTFGIDGEVYPWAPMLWNTSEGKAIEFGVKGNTQDMHTAGINFSVNNPLNPFTSIWVDCIRILDNEKAKAVLFFDSDKLQDPLHIAAVKIKSDKGVPAIYQGFPMECAGAGSEGTMMRQVLMHNYMDYLLNKTDISDALNPIGITMSPNPVSNQFILSIPQGIKEYSWNIYAQDGTLMSSGTSAQSQMVINCSGFSTGSYHGIVELGNQKSFIKFLVQH
ncbi:MAG: hypothetical protein EBU66_12550 [Bacteroidetes bacterium]|nr:hypothetical protein [Bacteroidota bacterium]